MTTIDINAKQKIDGKINDQEIVSAFARKLLVSRYSILEYYSDMDIEHTLPSIEEIREANSDANKMEAVVHKFIIFLNFLRKKAETLSNEEEQKEIIFPAEEVLGWLLEFLGEKPIYVATA